MPAAVNFDLRQDLPSAHSVVTLDPYEYQTQLFNVAVEKNIIAALHTGSGKTYIAVMLIRHLSYQVDRTVAITDGGRRTIFLVCTVPLAIQQAAYVHRHTALKVRCLVGNDGVDMWDRQQWIDLYNSHDIIVMTAGVFTISLRLRAMNFQNINLLIFDECHHAKKDHLYCNIMRHYDCDRMDIMPRILGLTASIIDQRINANDFVKYVRKIEMTLQAVAETGFACTWHRHELREDVVPYDISNCDLSAQFNAQLDKLLADVRKEICNRRKQSNATLDRIGQRLVAEEERQTENQRYSIEEYMRMLQGIDDTPMSITVIRRSLSALSLVLGELGLAGFCLAIRLLQSAKSHGLVVDDNPMSIKLRDDFWQLLTDMRTRVEDHVNSSSSLPITDKVARLLACLRSSNAACVPNPWKCIVFVQTRLVAQSLAWILSMLSRASSDEYGFIKPGYVCGQNVEPGHMTLKQQKDALNKFREDETNILVSTSVIEEGFDIPHCNNVVHFCTPATVASFIQAKGRARAKRSTYTMFIDKNQLVKFSETVAGFRKVENLLSRAINRSGAFDGFISDDEDEGERLVEIGSTRILPLDAVSILNEYCSVIASTGNACRPYLIFRKDMEPCKFQCHLILPRYCPVNEVIVSDVTTSKKAAKRSACIKALQILFAKGAINEYLVPSVVSLRKQNAEHMKAKQTGNQLCYTSMNEFTTLFPTVFQTCTDHVYICSVSSPPFPSFNMVFFRQVPALFGTKLYNPVDHSYVDVKVTLVKTTGQLPGHVYKALLQYHLKIYLTRMHQLSPVPVEDNSSACNKWLLCPPLKNDSIDFEALSAVLEPLNPQITVGSLIHRTYSPRQEELYIVDAFDEHIRPSHLMDRKSSVTFGQHYKHTYGIELAEEDTRFLRVSRLRKSSRVQLHISNAQKASAPFIEHLPLHKVAKIANHSVTQLFNAADIAVAVAHQLSNCLLSGHLMARIFSTTVGCSPDDEQVVEATRKQLCQAAIDWFDLQPAEGMREKDIPLGKISFQTTEQAIELTNNGSLLGLLKRACTLSSSLPLPYNLERLEILGDSFLKLSTTLYCFNSSNEECEGYLSELRSQIVCNQHLFNNAISFGLPQFLLKSAPSLYRTHERESDQCGWPAFFALPEPSCTFRIAGKRIADSVESIIAVFLISQGYEATLQVMNKCFGIKVEYGMVRPISPVCNDSPPETHHRLFKHIKLESLEEKLGYKFRNKHLALEAMTHGSAHFNLITRCYERLEFVGDAVVDFLVTRYIYIQGEHLGPGQMSFFRTAVVNNVTMAILCVKHNLYHHVLFVSVALCKVIDRFVQFVDPYTDCADKWAEIMWTCPEPPKMLADVFESVIGAIFIDSGYCLEQCWNVLSTLLGDVLDKFKDCVPENPISLVYQKCNGAKFETAELMSDGKKDIYQVKCHLSDKYSVSALGSDPVRAKRFAALKALGVIMNGKLQS